ncbi:DUF1176 domain-containing protein [Duganella sp. BJB488]|uniref:DUF1176 domain-containing protein n=1 Tax=unclassified Duganella TaxID=2636909 RepID=UPI000E350437|nr:MULTISPECIES: DUF1176 domain-containing protein [unclassified Duganella]NVD74389.1 DUF1176 domain-containing protein [Duganella sp. BJB1802]RFP10444.1 DUF1176 domain-containing protein [Duganella sp. BJB489]RFP14298.1 DUF1176 domain-containing protein [Duganella sp. BJB488]RFP30234.1 DUF1176 domain-containing protein [Duganella sp. BJB480]
MKILKLVLITSALASAVPADAAQYEGARFGAKDWEIACDNTRRCEAAGFQSEDGETESAPVALWLGRDAGAAAALEAKLMVVTPDDKDAGPLTITVGKLALGGLKADTALTAEQVARLMPQLLNAESAKVSDGTHQWRLSLAGLKAVLLKMDDLQGRVGTVTALVKPGTRPASAVLPPLAPPTVRPLAMPSAQKDDDKLLAAIVKTMRADDCSEDVKDANRYQDIHRLPGGKVLLMRECDRAAYQSSFVLWVARDKPPYDPKPVQLPAMGDGGVMNASFDGGKLTSFAKGRGVSDCGGFWTWVWTATGFQLVDMSQANMCRGMPGGVPLRDWVAREVK